MSEFDWQNRPNLLRVSKSAAAASALALLASGCGGPGKYGKYPDIPRCFKEPQAPLYHPLAAPKEPREPKRKPGESFKNFDIRWQKYNKAWLKWADWVPSELPRLNIPVHDGYAQGDPIYLPGIEDSTDEGLVRLDTGDWDGSGFLVKDRQGNEDVVTAAHVVSYAKLGALTITAENGTSTHAVSGCYLYEEKGKFIKMPDLKNEGHPVDIDLAILRLAKPIGEHTLKLTTMPLKRGQWLDFANYQGALHEPGYPANYTGVVVSREHDNLGIQVLTGARKLKVPVTVGETEDNEISAGASGGPVTDLHGKVVGISVAGNKDGIYDDADSLELFYNVRMPGAKFGLEHGFAPVTAWLVSSRLIEKAMASSRFWARSQLENSK